VGFVSWSDVLGSDEVAPGTVTSVELGEGDDVVVWRTASGRLAACDSRCPHQWSHLAAAGVVDGEELVCLSHFWRFDTDGHGSKLSMTGRRDPKGDVGTYAVRESDGRIEVLLADPAG
jgi:phenylpropionate dioxygenase-like ring-hydroxylating dioxygenase large terminal subunit